MTTVEILNIRIESLGSELIECRRQLEAVCQTRNQLIRENQQLLRENRRLTRLVAEIRTLVREDD